MLQIAICDDEKTQADYLQTLIKQWLVQSGVLGEIQIFQSAEAFLFDIEDRKMFDVVVLDIEMGEMNGIDLAKKIRNQDKSVQIIFVTGYMDYISEGYDVEALNYLLKPVKEEKFFRVLDRACERLKMQEKTLTIQMKDSVVKLPLTQIRYIEVERNYVTIHAAEDYQMKMTLAEMEKKMDERFVRTSRSFLVNMHFIKQISKTAIFLKDGAEVPLSRKMYETVNQKFIQFF